MPINYTDEQIQSIMVDCFGYWQEHSDKCNKECDIRCPFRDKAIATEAQIKLLDKLIQDFEEDLFVIDSEIIRYLKELRQRLEVNSNVS